MVLDFVLWSEPGLSVQCSELRVLQLLVKGFGSDLWDCRLEIQGVGLNSYFKVEMFTLYVLESLI